MPAMKMVVRLPKRRFIGSEIHEALYKKISTRLGKVSNTYNTAMAKYGPALMSPTSHVFLVHVPAAVHLGPLSGMPRASGKVRLAPLDPRNQTWLENNFCAWGGGVGRYLSGPILE